MTSCKDHRYLMGVKAKMVGFLFDPVEVFGLFSQTKKLKSVTNQILFFWKLKICYNKVSSLFSYAIAVLRIAHNNPFIWRQSRSIYFISFLSHKRLRLFGLQNCLLGMAAYCSVIGFTTIVLPNLYLPVNCWVLIVDDSLLSFSTHCPSLFQKIKKIF